MLCSLVFRSFFCILSMCGAFAYKHNQFLRHFALQQSYPHANNQRKSYVVWLAPSYFYMHYIGEELESMYYSRVFSSCIIMGFYYCEISECLRFFEKKLDHSGFLGVTLNLYRVYYICFTK
jgi:hypothetical protein